MTILEINKIGRPTRVQVDQIREFCETVGDDPTFDQDTLATCIESPYCGIFLADGTDLACLATCMDVLGNYTVLMADGGHRQFLQGEYA